MVKEYPFRWNGSGRRPLIRYRRWLWFLVRRPVAFMPFFPCCGLCLCAPGSILGLLLWCLINVFSGGFIFWWLAAFSCRVGNQHFHFLYHCVVRCLFTRRPSMQPLHLAAITAVLCRFVAANSARFPIKYLLHNRLVRLIDSHGWIMSVPYGKN